MTKEITIRKGGESRTFTLLPREQIEKTIKEADPWEIVARAHSEYIPGFKDGIVAVDLVTGRIVSYGLAPNEELHPFDSVEVVIYTLEKFQSPISGSQTNPCLGIYFNSISFNPL